MVLKGERKYAMNYVYKNLVETDIKKLGNYKAVLEYCFKDIYTTIPNTGW